MAAKLVLVCASALFMQVAYGQYLPLGSAVSGNSVVTNQINLGNGGVNLANSGIALANGVNSIGLANSYNNIGLANAGLIGNNVGVVGAGLTNINGPFVAYPDLLNIGSSGPFTVTTISPIGPSGLAVASENAIEGTLLVSGSLPFLSAVAFEGGLPTAGSGVATCGCGNGAVGILSEGFSVKTPGNVIGIGPNAGGIYF